MTLGVVLPNYYNVCSTSSACEVAINTAGGTSPVVVNAATAPIGALADGSFVLHDRSFAPEALAGAGETIPVRPILYGLGGLAVLGLAAGGGGGDGGGTPQAPAPNSDLKVTSPLFVNTRLPTITGEGEPGSRIVVQFDTDGDGRADFAY